MGKHLKFTICISVITAVISLILVSCSGSSDKVSVSEIPEAELYISSVTAPGYAGEEAYTEIYKNDFARLCFDKNTGAAAYGDAAGGKLWTSLPVNENDTAANIEVRVFSGSRHFILNSSVSIPDGTEFSYEETDKGFTVNYPMEADGISISVPVTYTLDGARLKAETDVSQWTVSEGTVIESVSILPFMGSSDYSYLGNDSTYAGDYFLVPDGQGAIMYQTEEDNETSELIFSVYGKDYYKKTVPACIGAYGIRSADKALAAVITEGDELALIKSYKSNADESGIARIYPEFIITPVSGESGKIRYGHSYDGKISVSYTALSGAESDYIGMAYSIRECLIREGFISSVSVGKNYPMLLSLTGSYSGGYSESFTDLDEAQELIKILRGKGVNGINLILEGFLTGGLKQKDASSLKVLSKLGGKTGLEDLCAYAKTQEVNVFTGANILSSASRSGAKDIAGNKISEEKINPLYPDAGKETYKVVYSGADSVSSGCAAVMNRLADITDGFCVLDAGRKIYADFSSENGSYSDMDRIIKENLSAFSVHGNLMVSGGNFNTIKNASAIKDIPLHPLIAESSAYEAVPFLGAVLHGTYIYSGKPANMADFSKVELLKGIECGAVPYYSWVFQKKTGNYYEKHLTEAVEFYLKAYEELSDLSDKRITDHFMYQEGVYCTVYADTAKVFVNYNNFSVTLGEISVMPYDYIRLG